MSGESLSLGHSYLAGSPLHIILHNFIRFLLWCVHYLDAQMNATSTLRRY